MVRQGARFFLPTVTVFALLAPPRSARADDEWLGRDKALHFGVSVALSAGGYAGSSLFLEKPWQRALAGSLFSLSVGAGKEGLDALTGGDPSFKDFAWDAAGTLVGAGVAFSVDVAWLAE
jgi:putative lipoprotein